MKVDKEKLIELTYPGRKKRKNYARLAGKAAVFAVCLALLGTGMVMQSMNDGESVSADALYDMRSADPAFTVQQLGWVESLSLSDEGDVSGGDITVLGNGGTRYAALDEYGVPRTEVSLQELYADYKTDWLSANTLKGMSLAGDGWSLKEAWFGRNAGSMNQSDFLVLDLGNADIGKTVLTNNPEHPGLSRAEGGFYVPDGDGGTVICLHDGDVVRLIFEPAESTYQAVVDMFDFDVTDDGWYASDDCFHPGEQKASSDASGTVYVDAMESGINQPGNYGGTGARLAFGADNIGTDLAYESLSGELDNLNVWNYDQRTETADTGVTRGLVSGVVADGGLEWAPGVSAPDLFGKTAPAGRTDYVNGEYGFSFAKSGNTRTLVTEGTGFWLLDGSKSAGTDGHDVLFGTDVWCYRSGDRAPMAFPGTGDGLAHDAFFGFRYTEDFQLSPGYTGPLGFFGYSDDDLWAFAVRLDGDGNVLPDTCVQAADLGGVHDPAGWYCNLWDKIEKVPYGGALQAWRLYVYWLDRDGLRSECRMRFDLPGISGGEARQTGRVVLEAADYASARGLDRTFVFDDGTHDRYVGILSDGTGMTILPGEEFTVPDGMSVEISGIPAGREYTLKETGAGHVWVSAGGAYEESGSVSCTAGIESKVSFLSSENAGALYVSVTADGDTPAGYFPVDVILDGMDGKEIPVMDGNGSPLGVRTVENGRIRLDIPADGSVVLYGLPDGTGFTVIPGKAPGRHPASGETFGSLIDGKAHAEIQYLEDELSGPDVGIQQSVTGDWGTADILLGTGSLLSYRITATNPNDVPMDVILEDTVPDGLEILSMFLPEGSTREGNTIRWEVTLNGNGSAELSFTCQVTAAGPAEFTNTAWAVTSDGAEYSSRTVKAEVPQ